MQKKPTVPWLLPHSSGAPQHAKDSLTGQVKQNTPRTPVIAFQCPNAIKPLMKPQELFACNLTAGMFWLVRIWNSNRIYDSLPPRLLWQPTCTKQVNGKTKKKMKPERYWSEASLMKSNLSSGDSGSNWQLYILLSLKQSPKSKYHPKNCTVRPLSAT